MSKDTTIFVGLDVYKDSITAAFIGSNPDEPVIDAGTIGTQQYAIDRLCKKLSGRGALRIVYEAGPCGFWLQRYLAGKGIACVVAAPPLIPKKPGERIKTDRRYARNLALALALRACNLSFVHVPTTDRPVGVHLGCGSNARADILTIVHGIGSVTRRGLKATRDGVK